MNGKRSPKGRFALLTVGRLVLGAGALFRSLETYRDGSGFLWPLVPFVFLVAGLFLLWWGAQGLVALFFSKTQAAHSLITSSVAAIDSRAPSGLKPLWVTLGVLMLVFLLWALLRNLLGAA